MRCNRTTTRIARAITVLLALLRPAPAQHEHAVLMNEQSRILYADPPSEIGGRLPRVSTPPTVLTGELPTLELSLDEAIRLAVQNADAIRVLSGVGAASTGLTIYSPAISNTTVDQARAVFDPNLTVRNNFLRGENPSAVFDPLDPRRALIVGSRSDTHDFELDLNKQMLGGANAGLRVGTNRSRLQPGVFPINPRSTSAVDLSLSQPLLRGRGADVNSVPVVLAFLDTQRSYFQLKNSLQNMVQGVIQGYWDLVQARLDLWVLRQQIRQTEAANTLAQLRLELGLANLGESSQTRSSLANFRASVIAAETSLLDRVASMRAILGMPPTSEYTIVPTTPPIVQEMQFDWNGLVQMAEERRPDLIELKLVLDADYQRILQARNLAQPQLDATALYRWNGLEGEMPIGDRLTAPSGDYTDWALAVNFSVPLMLRADRANLRRNELLLASDQTNLRQRLLEVSHGLASSLRTLDQVYAQYQAFKLARDASVKNLELQFESFAAGIINFVDLLLAINTWGTAVSNEARSITQFNAGLANLETQTGTILESHGIRLLEERYCSLGPLGRFGKGREYPQVMRPSPNTPRYEAGDRPAEEAFDLTAPVRYSSSESERLPPVPRAE